MVPKHKKHAGHHGGQPSISYLTDDALAFDSEAAMATLAAAPAPPPTRTNEELNLAVLQRHYPAVEQILSIANFATLYTLHPQTQAWDKANCDGTLFVCALQPSVEQAERYALVILNRRELKNFYLELLSPSMVEFEEPFVMLKDELDNVSGLFISAEPAPASTAQMREINVGVIQECAVRAEESRAATGHEQWGAIKGRQDEVQGAILAQRHQDSDYSYGGRQDYYQAPVHQQYEAHQAQGHQQQQQQQQQQHHQPWPPQQTQQHAYYPQQQSQFPQHQQHHQTPQFPQQHQSQYSQHQLLQQQQPQPQEHELLRLFARAKASAPAAP